MKQRYFEWLDGELKGTVSVLDYIEEEGGSVYYNFTDGEICNEDFISKMTSNVRDLAGKMLVEVPNATDIWRQEEVKARVGTKDQYGESVEIPTLEDVLAANGQQNATISKSSIGSMKWVAPSRMPDRMPDLPSIKMYGKPAPAARTKAPAPSIQRPVAPVPPVEAAPAVAPVAPVVEEPELAPLAAPYTPPKPMRTSSVAEDPVAILVRKCKKHSTDVDLTVTMDLPARSTFELIANEFDGGADKFIAYVLAELSPELVFEALRDALLDAYCNNSVESDTDK